MSSIAKDNALPTPATVEERCTQVRRTSPSGQFVFSGRPNAALSPRVWILSWIRSPAPVIDAARRHWKDHTNGSFTLRLPITGELVTVGYLSPLSIQWHSAVSASATVEVEEALAHE